MLNPTLNMDTLIISMKRACYLQLRSLSKIRKYLTQEAAEKLTHAFVTSRLDNLNSLLINTPSFQVQQLQLIQNTAARIVTQAARKKVLQHHTHPHRSSLATCCCSY